MAQSVSAEQIPALLPLLPHPPLLSSQQSSWKGIYVEHHRQSACELPEQISTRHVICVHQFQQTTRLERSLNGRMQNEQVGCGEIAIIPAMVSHKLRWTDEGEFTLVMLDPTHVAQMAHTSIEIDNLEVTPQFATADPLVFQIVQTLKSELECGGVCSQLFIESLTTTLAIHLIRRYSTRKFAIPEYAGGLSKPQLRHVLTFIEEHLDRNLSLYTLANLVQLSPHYFASLFKQSTGQSPHQYVLQCRIQRAKQLLAPRDLAIAQIAQQVGFENQSHFTTAFRRLTTVTPKAYRNQIRDV